MVTPRFVLILQLTSSRIRHYSTVVEMLALLWYGIVLPSSPCLALNLCGCLRLRTRRRILILLQLLRLLTAVRLALMSVVGALVVRVARVAQVVLLRRRRGRQLLMVGPDA